MIYVFDDIIFWVRPHGEVLCNYCADMIECEPVTYFEEGFACGADNTMVDCDKCGRRLWMGSEFGDFSHLRLYRAQPPNKEYDK